MAELVLTFWGIVPGSEKTIVKLFIQQKCLNQKQIREKTRLSARTVKYALKSLIHRGLVIENNSFSDMRNKVYALKFPKVIENV